MALHSAKRAEELARRGDFKAAERLYRGILLSSPRSFEALRGLGVLLRRQGRNTDAIERLGAALKVRPDEANALAELGLAQASAGDYAAALDCYDRALARNPEPETWNHRGVTVLALGRANEAVESFDRAIALRPNFAVAQNNRANALGRLERPEEALASYDLAIAADPDLSGAINSKAMMLQELGRFDEAIALAEQAVARWPTSALFYVLLAEVRELSPDDPRVIAMTALAANETSVTEWERANLNFALGKVFAAAGDHARAFSHLLLGNAQKRRNLVYDEETTLGAIRALPNVFTRELLKAGAQLGEPSERPIFVLGMPRSGTTLVEQILASHPRVFGAGETGLFNSVLQGSAGGSIDQSVKPSDAAELWAGSMRGLGASYLSALAERSTDEPDRVVDKTLENWRVIGLIRLALPNARIIHVSRHPLDACVSCFSRQFLHLPYTYDLAELGRHYNAYVQLMEHWRAVTPERILLDVRYEDVVADLEGQARRLIAHCGLEWDPRCLDFHRTERRVQTASARQVRQPIYDRSIGTWRSYEANLAPLIEALGPLADR
jgi:tetratricopeptide (TPR) repeat protein